MAERIKAEKVVKATLDGIIEGMSEGGYTDKDLTGLDLLVCFSIRDRESEGMYVLGTSTEGSSQAELIGKFLARMIAAGDITIDQLQEAAKNVNLSSKEGEESSAVARTIGIRGDKFEVVKEEPLDEHYKKAKKENPKEETKDDKKDNSIMDRIRRMGKL